MHTRFPLLLGLMCFVAAVAVAAFFSGGFRFGVEVKLTPREEDGTQAAVDFVKDLDAGNYESAWERTALAYRDETDYDGFVIVARRYFSDRTGVIIEADAQPGAIVGRISYDTKPPVTFRVEADQDTGFWLIRQLSYGE